MSEKGTTGHLGKWQLASPIINLLISFANLVWNLQAQAFKLMDSDIPDERCWTSFPSQPFPFYPPVEQFRGSLALHPGVLADPALRTSSVPLCCPCLRLEHELVGERRWFLSPQNYLWCQHWKEPGSILVFQHLLETQFRRIIRVHFHSLYS